MLGGAGVTPWEAAFGGSIDCVFLDAGGVLFHDEPVELYYLSLVTQRLRGAGNGEIATADDLFHARERLLGEGARDWINQLGRAVAGGDWDGIVADAWAATVAALGRLCVPCRGALGAVAALAGRYRLCCVANQPPEAETVLRDLGFAHHLEHILLDTVVQASKPDPRIFRMALERMGVGPERVVFVGDRPDNDIVPARRLGMKTVWLRKAPRCFVPAGVSEEFAARYHESLSRIWHHNGPASATVMADLTGEELASLVPPSW